MTENVKDGIEAFLYGIEERGDADDADEAQHAFLAMAKNFKGLIRTFEETFPAKIDSVYAAINDELDAILARLYDGAKSAKAIAEDIRAVEDDERVYGRYEDQVRSTYRDGLL
jgi:hypothetical protein